LAVLATLAALPPRLALRRLPSLPMAFDVATAYLDVLLAQASRRVQEDAVRWAEAILEDTVARRKGGVAFKLDYAVGRKHATSDN